MLEDQLDLEGMRLGVHQRFPITFNGQTIMLRPLSISEHNEVTAKVVSELRSKPPEFQTELNQASLMAVYSLEKASTVDPTSPLIPLPAQWLSRLSEGELMYLYQEFMAITKKVDPRIEEIPAERLNSLIAEVKKNPSLSTLDSLSFKELAQVVRYLVTSAE